MVVIAVAVAGVEGVVGAVGGVAGGVGVSVLIAGGSRHGSSNPGVPMAC